jgi:hypothetical protein
MAEVLESDRRRMISISGPPGVGKTRVAAEVAGRLSARRGWPVLWIGADPLAPAGDGTAFGPLLRALRALFEAQTDDVSGVCRLVGRHELLLVLDGVADARAPVGWRMCWRSAPAQRVPARRVTGVGSARPARTRAVGCPTPGRSAGCSVPVASG